MSQILIDKLRKCRESNITVGEFTFTVRRPTDYEAVQMARTSIDQGSIMRQFVIGWGGVREIDIIPGGDATPVPFDSELFMSWVADKPKLWGPLTDAVMQAYARHRERMEESLGEQENISTA